MADEDEGPAIQVRRASVMRGEVASASDLDGHPEPAPPTPAPAPPATESLELDRAPARPSRSNPELDEWNREFSTGEFRIPKSDEGPSVEGPPTPLPVPAKTDPGGGGGGAPVGKIAIAVVVLLVVGGIGAKLAWSKINAKPAATTASDDGTEASDDFVRRMQEAGENAPDCWTSDEGYEFVYKDTGGEMVKVDRIREVPVLHRKNAVCVPE